MSQSEASSPDLVDPKHQRTIDISMNHAGRDSSHQFQDFRSPHRAASRTRTRDEKYYHFKGLSPADLSSPHYIPVCPNLKCAVHDKDTANRHLCGEPFYPPISTAPVRRFSKREAFEQTQQWPRPPTYHHTYQKDKPKKPKIG
jgi:hypothetical protein